jgi:hypothetical protein
VKKLFYHESTKEKKNFVLSKFRVFVINPFWFAAFGGSGSGYRIVNRIVGDDGVIGPDEAQLKFFYEHALRAGVAG